MRKLTAVLSLLSLLLFDSAFSRAPATALEKTTPQLQQAVDQKRVFYNQHFKEIQFVFFEGGENWTQDIDTLGLLLGHKPSTMDYEHPPDLREELMDVVVTDFIHMLSNNIPKARLFKADSPLGWRENICAISLNPAAIASSDAQATRFMFDMTAAAVEQLAAEKRLPAHQFLHFLIDHEIFHCLDSYYNGPQPMSHEALWGEYHGFRGENGADAFALAMNIRQQGEIGTFPLAIMNYRGVSFYHGDFDHWSYAAIKQLLSSTVDQLRSLTVSALFHKASEIRDSVVGNYGDYLTYRTTAYQTMRLIDAGKTSFAPDAVKPGIDHALMEKLLAVFRTIRQEHPHLVE